MVVKPQVTADYSPWVWAQFKPVDPALSTLVVQEQATLVAGTESPRISVAEASSPTPTSLPPNTLTSAAATSTLQLTSTVQFTPTPRPSETIETEAVQSPTSTSTPDVTISSTPSPTRTVTSTGTTTATATVTRTVTTAASFTPTATLTIAPTRTRTLIPTSTLTPTALPSWTPTIPPTQTLTPIPPPTAGFWANPMVGQAPLGVAFTNTSTGLVAAYNWTFGDGVGLSNLANPFYSYNFPGTYSVSLTIYGPGGSSTATTLITVLPPPTPIPSPTNTPVPTNTPRPPRANLAVSMTVNDNTPNEGDAISFTVTVTNSGPNTDNGIQVGDALPAGFTLTGSTPSQGSYAGGVWTVGTLTNGATATLTLNAQVNVGTGGSILTNTATVTAASLPDLTPGNNSASASVTVQVPATADLAVSKTVDDNTPNEWQIVTFTVTVTNNGPDTDNGIQVDDSLPPGFWLMSDTASQGSYFGGVWNVGTLTNGATATLTLDAWIWGGTGGSTLTNTATITAASLPETVGANDTASVSVTVQIPPTADLAISKTVDNSTPNEGDAITFTVSITNNGPDTDNGIQVNDALPAGLTLTGNTPSQGSYIGGVWNVGTLTNGAAATLTLNAQVDAGTGGSTLTNTATITAASLPDPVGANDSASASVMVQIPAIADLAVNKMVDDNTPNEGDPIIFTVTVTNN
ncbi:MAG: DUF11 domain-containing protein, partial [Chloroflexi bacterium]|nr:DUF11 domain-containing protein [Chloroflexota bacterium]